MPDFDADKPYTYGLEEHKRYARAMDAWEIGDMVQFLQDIEPDCNPQMQATIRTRLERYYRLTNGRLMSKLFNKSGGGAKQMREILGVKWSIYTCTMDNLS